MTQAHSITMLGTGLIGDFYTMTLHGQRPARDRVGVVYSSLRGAAGAAFQDLRDEVAGTEGTIWLNHFLRTGFEMYTSGEGGGYVAEKSESESGWLFPVGDEVSELGYVDMFTDMFDSMEAGRLPRRRSTTATWSTR